MRYLVTMTIDIEEVKEKVVPKKPTPAPPPVEPTIKPVPTEQPAGPMLYSIKQVGAALGISRSVVYQLINEGALPVIRIGKRTLFTDQDLKDFIERSREHQSDDRLSQRK